MTQFDYIISDPAILGGKPIIKGSRISVQMILEWIASGATVEAIVETYTHLPEKGVREALIYASQAMNNEILIEIRTQRIAA